MSGNVVSVLQGAPAVATQILMNMDAAGGTGMTRIDLADYIYESIVGPCPPCSDGEIRQWASMAMDPLRRLRRKIERFLMPKLP